MLFYKVAESAPKDLQKFRDLRLRESLGLQVVDTNTEKRERETRFGCRRTNVATDRNQPRNRGTERGAKPRQGANRWRKETFLFPFTVTSSLPSVLSSPVRLPTQRRAPARLSFFSSFSWRIEHGMTCTREKFRQIFFFLSANPRGRAPPLVSRVLSLWRRKK